MKKFYKPLARVEKASQIFKKKTLNVNDNLNVKHDDDDIENVEDYWNTAVSVIGNSTIDSIDHSILTEVSDTLFNINNIRKSIRNTLNEDKNKITIKQLEKDSIKIPESHFIRDQSTILDFAQEPEVKNFKNSNTSVNDDTDIQPWNQLDGSELIGKMKTKEALGNFEKENKTNKVENIKENLIEKPTTETLKDNETDNSVKKANQREINYFEDSGFDYNAEPALFPIDVSHSETNSMEVNINELEEKIKTESEMQVLKSFSTKKAAETSPVKKKVEKSKPTKRMSGSFVVEKASKGIRCNTTSPIVCSKTLNTAIMSFDYFAYCSEFKAENSFSLYVIKGQVQISVNDSKKIVKNGETTIIEKGDVYSIDCFSKNGAKLFLTFAL